MTSGTVDRKYRNWRSAKKRRRFNYFAKDYPQLEKMFYCYDAIKKELKEIEDERTYYKSGFKEGGGSSNHAFISDPTSQLAIKFADGIKKVIIFPETYKEATIEDPQKWVFVVEKTLEHFKYNNTILEIIKRRYFKNESYVRTCSDLNIEDTNEYYRLKDAGLNYARDCAIQVGLIKVF